MTLFNQFCSSKEVCGSAFCACPLSAKLLLVLFTRSDFQFSQFQPRFQVRS